MAVTLMTEKTQHNSMELLSGKHLTFKLGSEIYGLAILKVQEIIGLMPTTSIPKVPQYVRGIINLRGRVITVVDLRRKFLMDDKEDTERTCIVVVQVILGTQTITIGLVVDEVCEVLDIPSNQIDPPPVFGQDVNTDYIRGIGKITDKVILLLDVDLILNHEDALFVNQVLDNQRTA